MDTKIRFIKTAPHPKGGDQPATQFNVTLTPEGCDVAVGDAMRPSVPWEHVEDVEWLADTFWMLQVWQFKEVILLLAQAVPARGLLQVAA